MSNLDLDQLDLNFIFDYTKENGERYSEGKYKLAFASFSLPSDLGQVGCLRGFHHALPSGPEAGPMMLFSSVLLFIFLPSDLFGT